MPVNEESRSKAKVFDHNGEVPFREKRNVGKGSRSRISNVKKFNDNWDYFCAHNKKKREILLRKKKKEKEKEKNNE